MRAEQAFETYGALNAFMSSNDLTPADIAGDKGNLKSLQELVE